MERPTVDIPDVREKGVAPDGGPLASDRRLFMLLLAWSGCGSCRLLRLRLGLRGGRSNGRGGLEKVLVAQENNEHERGERQRGAHIAAAATAAAGALRLKIGIANFGQRILPVVKRRHAVRQPLVLW